MKTIILSASTGGGHMSAANAIKDYLVENNNTAEVIDALEYINPLLNKTITETYEYIAIKNPLLWKMMYKSSNKKSGNKLVEIANSLISIKLLPLIENHKPDVIITTHPFTTEMVSRLKYKNKIQIPLVCIMTDYAPHRTWLNDEVDAYVIANENMITPMIEMGADINKIHPFGIPVDDAFFSKTNKKDFLKNLDFDPNIPTLLIMAGSCGFANIEKMYNQLKTIPNEFQVIIITGKNQKLYKKMQNVVNPTEPQQKNILKSKISKLTFKLKHPRILKHSKIIKNHVEYSQKRLYEKKTKIIYFTNEVNKYMGASDLILTKPGGLTISEALACNLPMALYDAIPGQEEENAEFLVNNHMAIKLDSKKDISQTIQKLLTEPKILNSMKDNCENFDKSQSLKNISDLIKTLINK